MKNIIRGMMNLNRIRFEKIPAYGHAIPINTWLKTVDAGGFIDYDGDGNLASIKGMSELQVKPSFVENGKIQYVIMNYDFDNKIPYEDEWGFTHVIWFNK